MNYPYAQINAPAANQFSVLSPRDSKKRELRKTLSGLGYLIFSVNMLFLAMYFIFAVASAFPAVKNSEFFNENYISIENALHGVISITSMVGLGILYCLLSSTKLSSVIKFSPVKSSRFIAYIFMGLGIAYMANYITNIFLTNIEIIGISYNSPDDYENMNMLASVISTFVTAVVPAFSEEFLFRGILLGKLRKYGDGYAILVSSLFFALMHGNMVQIPFAFIGGVMFAFLTVKTGSILPAMAVHFSNNFLSCIQNLVINNSSEYVGNFIASIIFSVILVLGIAAFVYIIKKDKGFFAVTPDRSMPSLSLKCKFGLLFSNSGSIFSFLLLLILTLSTISFG